MRTAWIPGVMIMCALATMFMEDDASAQRSVPMETYIYKTIANPPPYEGTAEIEADVHAPKDGKRHPVLVYFHGGALIGGGRPDIKLKLDKFCEEEGYIFVSANYRLGPEIKVPGILEDVRDVLLWVREKGPELFGADPDSIVVCGSSAGGYLTLMAGTMEPRPKALLSMWGYGDILGDWYTTPYPPYSEREVDKEAGYAEVYKQVVTEASKRTPGAPIRGRKFYPYLRHEGLWTKELTGFDPETEREKIVPFCPEFNVTPDYPPTLFFHGEKDSDVPVEQSIGMAAALKEKGVEHELVIVPGAGHTLGGATPKQKAEVRDKACEFLRKHLGKAER